MLKKGFASLLLLALTLLAVSPAFAQQEEDLDCSDFDSQAEAQTALEEDDQDPNGLDGDNDGQACEEFFGGNGATGDQYAGGEDGDQYADRDVDADVDIDQVCENVVNIIVENDQYQDADADVDNDQYVVAGDDQVAVDLDNRQVAGIAQELDVSPVIVQQCIQQVGDNDDDTGDTDDTGTDDDTDEGDADADANGDGVIDDTVPAKDLPNTGGFPLTVVGGLALLSAYGVLAAWRLKARER